MSLIINTKLTQLKKGFPTTTDKYTVRGATLNAASADVGNGDLIEYVGDGSFKKASATTTVATLAGVCLRSLTHVVNGLTGTGEVVHKAGDTIDLVVGGFICVEVAASVDLDDITENAPVRLLNGTLVVDSSSGTQIPGWYFTGTKEQVGGKKLAGIVIKEIF